ncbi:hypothetical protein PLICRDRAFT_503995 [Plicaturopsis crispa FD-325 SS-3]|nr:hypothetical protein PLICRDRAFT_503995 [Plicaturopsis crispa FD-325 SS-3]
MPTALVIGASRGLGLELTKAFHAAKYTVFATTRSPPAPGTFPEGVNVIPHVDVGTESAGPTIVAGLSGAKLDRVILNAAVFHKESFEDLNWDAEVEMYATVAIAPVFLVHHLVRAEAFVKGAKFAFITTEGGSITLRTKEEGGGNFGHHGSKAAANMVGKLLSFELEKIGVTAVLIHPSFMKTDMVKNVGYDKFFESGGAVTAAEAAHSILDFVDTVQPAQNGTFWAPRGARDIGEAERVLGKNLPTPLPLPW